MPFDRLRANGIILLNEQYWVTSSVLRADEKCNMKYVTTYVLFKMKDVTPRFSHASFCFRWEMRP